MIPCQRKLLSHQHSCTGFERIMRTIRTSNWLIVLAVVLTPSSVSCTARDSKHSREPSTLPSTRTPYRCGRGRAYAANVPSIDLRTNTSVTLAGEESTKIHSSTHLAFFCTPSTYLGKAHTERHTSITGCHFAALGCANDSSLH